LLPAKGHFINDQRFAGYYEEIESSSACKAITDVHETIISVGVGRGFVILNYISRVAEQPVTIHCCKYTIFLSKKQHGFRFFGMVFTVQFQSIGL